VPTAHRLRRTHRGTHAPHAGSRSRVRVPATPRRRLARVYHVVCGGRLTAGRRARACVGRPAKAHLAQTTTITRCVHLAPTSVAQLFPAETVKRFSDVACAALRNPIRKNAREKRTCKTFVRSHKKMKRQRRRDARRPSPNRRSNDGLTGGRSSSETVQAKAAR